MPVEFASSSHRERKGVNQLSSAKTQPAASALPLTRSISNPIRQTFAVLTLLLILSTAAFAQDAKPTTLAWKLKTGEQLDLEFHQQQKTLTRIDARDRTLESELILGVQWNVTAVANDGTATIDQTIKRIRIRTGTPGAEVKKTVDIDTAIDDTPRGVSRDVMKSVEKMVGLTFVVEMTAAGKVISVTPAANVAKALQDVPETSALRNLFSAAAMERLIRDSAFTLSEDAVAEGGAWNEDSELSITTRDGRELGFDRVVTSTATEMTQQQATIGLEIELSQKPLPTEKMESALTSPLELVSFTGAGEMLFDRSSGIITSSKVTSEMKTRVIYRADQIQTTINTTNRVTVSRK